MAQRQPYHVEENAHPVRAFPRSRMREHVARAATQAPTGQPSVIAMFASELEKWAFPRKSRPAGQGAEAS